MYTLFPGDLKIVVSTNVAEASVTLPDVSVVIDSCKVKQTDIDPERGMTALITQYASHDSLRQRRGRAGRVQEGRCFRMVTLNTYEKLPAHGIPEILRVPLDNVVLQLKAMPLTQFKEDRRCHEVLSLCLDPPSSEAIVLAEKNLIRIQALDSTNKSLTPLGRHLASLPCSPCIGRLMIYGRLFEFRYLSTVLADQYLIYRSSSWLLIPGVVCGCGSYCAKSFHRFISGQDRVIHTCRNGWW